MTAKGHTVDSHWRKQQRIKHVREFGLVCQGIVELGIQPHEVIGIRDLQVDHITPIHKGGSEYGPVRIVCGPCNTAHRNETYSKLTKAERDHPPVVGAFTRGPLADL